MTLRAGALVLAAQLTTAVQAAELGDVTVRSYIGQQLSADIELVSLAPDEVGGLQVRLAPVDVYQGASIAMNPALATVHLSVVRREQRQFLHVTTLKAIDTSYVHLFLELGVPGRHEVRTATVWLQADPHPPPPMPAPMESAAPAPAAHEGQEGREGMAPTSDAALTAALMRARHRAPVARPAARAAASAPSGDAATMQAAKAEASAGKRPAAGKESAPAMAVPPASHAAAPASCPPQTALRAKECVVLDSHSTVLSSKLVELEGKVKVLQMALDGKPEAPAAAVRVPRRASAGTAGAAGPQAASTAAAAASAASLPSAAAAAGASHAALPKLKYKKEVRKAKPVEEAPFDTGLLAAAGAALLALLAGAGYVWYRRRKAGQGSAPLKIWQGWRKKKTAGKDDGAPAPADEAEASPAANRLADQAEQQ